MEKYNIVWFKKDLRANDHRPLLKASKLPCICLYALEPIVINHYSFDSAKAQFLKESLLSLEKELKKYGGQLIIIHNDIISILNLLSEQFVLNNIYAHEEISSIEFWQRDKDVNTWCKKHKIEFKEYQQFGVNRPNKNRDGWAKHWHNFIDQPIDSITKLDSPKQFHQNDIAILDNIIKKEKGSFSIQEGGRDAAINTLESFLNKRGLNYASHISSPALAEESGSRLSPYLSFGCLSMKETVNVIEAKLMTLKTNQDSESKTWKKSLRRVLERLHWHCHFIQKLEDEPLLDRLALSPTMQTLIDNSVQDETLLTAWKEGKTGYPMIDACMRYLTQHKWINFRMRAMLVSFASYHLNLDWRVTSKWLARQFLDFEPGIHYPQIQMQSGTTGMNAIRIYSPEKQGIDQDPDGLFIKKYVPELKHCPIEYIHNPSNIPPLLSFANFELGTHYPYPIVDHKTAYKAAKDRVFSIRKEISQKEKHDLLKKHASRRK